MKPSNESPPNTPSKASATPGTPKQKPVIEPPTQPFINLSGDGPVDPTKFQLFIVPMEFIEKANAVELPGLDPDDLLDTDPPNQTFGAADDRARGNESAARSEPPAPTRHDQQDTVVIPKRRKSAPIPKELLNGAPSTSPPPAKRKRKLLWIFAGLLLIVIAFLSWTHLNVSSEPDIDGVSGSQAEAPNVPSESIAIPEPPPDIAPTVLPRKPSDSSLAQAPSPIATPSVVNQGPSTVSKTVASKASPKVTLPAPVPSASAPRKTFWTPIDG